MLIHSKFKKGRLRFFIAMLVFWFLFTLYIIRGFILHENYDTESLLLFSFFIGLNIILLLILRDFKVITIDSKENTLKFTSLFQPFGKTIDLSNYNSFINVQQFSAHGDFISTYLIQKNGIANFKISSFEYINHKQLIESLNLSEVKRNLDFKDYMTLLYVGKLKLKHKNSKKSNESAVDFYKKVLRFIIFIGFVCFLFGMVLKMCSST